MLNNECVLLHLFFIVSYPVLYKWLWPKWDIFSSLQFAYNSLLKGFFFFAFGTCLVTIPGKKKAPSERSDFGSKFAVAVTHYLIVQVVWVCHAKQSLRLHITCEYWMLRAILWVLLRINFWLKPRVNCMGESGSVAFGKCYRYTVLGCTKAVNLSSRYACRRSPNKTEWKQAFSTTHVHNLLQLGHWK